MGRGAELTGMKALKYKVDKWKLRWGKGSVVCPHCLELLMDVSAGEVTCPVCGRDFKIEKKVVTFYRSKA